MLIFAKKKGFYFFVFFCFFLIFFFFFFLIFFEERKTENGKQKTENGNSRSDPSNTVSGPRLGPVEKRRDCPVFENTLARPKLEAIHVEICALVLFVVVVVATHVVVALVPFPKVVRPIIAGTRVSILPFKAVAETVPVRAFILWVATQAAWEVAAVFVAPATAGGANLMAALALTLAYQLVTEATVLSDVDPCELQPIGKLLLETFPVVMVQVVHRVRRHSQRLPITGGATFRLAVEGERVPLFRKSLRKVSEKFRKRGSHSKVLLSQDEPHEVVHHHHGFK